MKPSKSLHRENTRLSATPFLSLPTATILIQDPGASTITSFPLPKPPPYPTSARFIVIKFTFFVTFTCIVFNVSSIPARHKLKHVNFSSTNWLQRISSAFFWFSKAGNSTWKLHQCSFLPRISFLSFVIFYTQPILCRFFQVSLLDPPDSKNIKTYIPPQSCKKPSSPVSYIST